MDFNCFPNSALYFSGQCHPSVAGSPGAPGLPSRRGQCSASGLLRFRFSAPSPTMIFCANVPFPRSNCASSASSLELGVARLWRRLNPYRSSTNSRNGLRSLAFFARLTRRVFGLPRQSVGLVGRVVGGNLKPAPFTQEHRTCECLAESRLSSPLHGPRSRLDITDGAWLVIKCRPHGQVRRVGGDDYGRVLRQVASAGGEVLEGCR